MSHIFPRFGHNECHIFSHGLATMNVTYFPTVWPQKNGLKTSFSKENSELTFNERPSDRPEHDTQIGRLHNIIVAHWPSPTSATCWDLGRTFGQSDASPSGINCCCRELTTFIEVGGQRQGLGVEGDCSRGRGGTGVGRGGQRQEAR